MTGDDLRDRLAAANPTPPDETVDPITSDRARALMEDIMSTETTIRPRTERRAYRLAGAVAAALVVVLGGATLLGGLGTAEEPLALTGEGGDIMAICAPFEVDVLAEMAPAFAGTVTEITDSVATLEVDRWFAGEEVGTVEISFTPGFEALIGTPSFEAGQRYLVTATDGVVNGCGYSGPATPELEAAFEQAFGI